MADVLGMMGFSHAMSGALGWLYFAPKIVPLLGLSLSPAELAIGTVACAGAALIPDLDHPQATIARTFGPVSHAASQLTALLSGGHRMGTHSLLFSVGFGAFCYLVGTSVQWVGSSWPAIVLMFLLAAFAFRGLNIVPPMVNKTFKGLVVIGEAALLTFGMTFVLPSQWWWLGLAGFMGAIIHLIGDTLTPEGVPWFFPSKWRIAFPLISHTGNGVETKFLAPLMGIGVAWQVWVNFSPLFGGVKLW